MLHVEVLQWQMKPSPFGGAFDSDVFDFGNVPNTTEYRVTRIHLSYDRPSKATIEPLHIHIGKHEKGVYNTCAFVCGNAIVNRLDPVPNTRVVAKKHFLDGRPMLAMGGSWDIIGPFDTDGLFLFASAKVPVSGQVHVFFEAVVKSASMLPPCFANLPIGKNDVPEIETKAEAEPECVCKSLLFGHERGCPFAK